MKFGGSGRSKQSCKQRKCENMIDCKVSQDNTIIAEHASSCSLNVLLNSLTLTYVKWMRTKFCSNSIFSRTDHTALIRLNLPTRSVLAHSECGFGSEFSIFTNINLSPPIFFTMVSLCTLFYCRVKHSISY